MHAISDLKQRLVTARYRYALGFHIDRHHHVSPSKLSQAKMFLLCVREVPGSNFGRVIQ
jgi:hypothetical protein